MPQRIRQRPPHLPRVESRPADLLLAAHRHLVRVRHRGMAGPPLQVQVCDAAERIADLLLRCRPSGRGPRVRGANAGDGTVDDVDKWMFAREERA